MIDLLYCNDLIRSKKYFKASLCFAYLICTENKKISELGLNFNYGFSIQKHKESIAIKSIKEKKFKIFLNNFSEIIYELDLENNKEILRLILEEAYKNVINNSKFDPKITKLARDTCIHLKLKEFYLLNQVSQKYRQRVKQLGIQTVRLKHYKNNNYKKFNQLTRNHLTNRFKNYKVAIYTAIFGNYDQLRFPIVKSDNLDFICFSDKNYDAFGWKTKKVEILDKDVVNNESKNRYFKMLCHKVLKEYDYSLYIDSNMVICCDLNLLIRQYLQNIPFSCFPHAERSDLNDEIEANLLSSKGELNGLINQIKFLNKNNFEDDKGLLEANILWRSHKNKDVQNLMEKWWELYKKFYSRDQLLLGYLIQKKDINIKVLPSKLGNSRANIFLKKTPHINEIKNYNSSNNNFKLNISNNQKRNLVFLYHSKGLNVASTIMRVFQLCDILNNFGKIDSKAISEQNISDIKDSIVILNKSFLKRVKINDLNILKNKGNLICADYIDDKPSQNLLEKVDVLIASSIKQYLFYLKSYPNKLSHLITHHTDPRLKLVSQKLNQFKIGYFGETINAKFGKELKKVIDIIGIDTKNSNDQSWMNIIGNYNAHYLVRNNRPIDGFKPFLKGFTASKYSSNILAYEEDGDALFYLTKDYPYLLTDSSLNSIKNGIDYMKESFLSKDWFDGIEIMKSVQDRCSNQFIINEIKSLYKINYLIPKEI